MWYQKYKTQHDENAKLEENIKSLEEKLLELQGHFREGYCGLFVEVTSGPCAAGVCFCHCMKIYSGLHFNN